MGCIIFQSSVLQVVDCIQYQAAIPGFATPEALGLLPHCDSSSSPVLDRFRSLLGQLMQRYFQEARSRRMSFF
jgi:hypothetical protein